MTYRANKRLIWAPIKWIQSLLSRFVVSGERFKLTKHLAHNRQVILLNAYCNNLNSITANLDDTHTTVFELTRIDKVPSNIDIPKFV